MSKIDLYKGDCLEREDGVTYIATISGGKDSVAQADLLCKNGYPVDYIIFQNTLLELPMMYKYIEKLKKYFFSRYKKEVIALLPDTTFEEWCFGVIRDKNSMMSGHIRGIPIVWAEPCFWRRESKEKPSNKFIKENNIQKSLTYIGYTYKENRSIKDTENHKFYYPLKYDFKMTETDCQEYLVNQDMENPIYRFLTRSGCGVCPAQSDKAWYGVWKNSKDDWDYMKFVESRLNFYESQGMKVKNKHWFTRYRTCEDMEKLFKEKDKQGSLFDFNDEPLKDCFCKI